MTRFVGAEFQVNQICGEEQETRKITAEYQQKTSRINIRIMPTNY